MAATISAILAQRRGEGIGSQRQRQQQRAHRVEAGVPCFRRLAISGQVAAYEQKIQDTQRHIDEENGLPAEARNQQAAERGSERGANR